MSPAVSIDPNALSAAIVRGVVEGMRPVVESMTAESKRRHELRNTVQDNSDKLWQLDSEVKLLKGFAVTLMGSGDGNGGMVNRMDHEMEGLRGDVSTMKTQMQQMNGKIDGLVTSISTQKSFMDGWKGVGIAIGIIGTCVTVAGSVITALAWFINHGVKP